MEQNCFFIFRIRLLALSCVLLVFLYSVLDEVDDHGIQHKL